MKTIKAIALFLLLAGCATTGEYNDAGVKPFVQDAANRSWLYAQLSSNAYGASEFKSSAIEKDCDIHLDNSIRTSDCSIQFKSGFKAVVNLVKSNEKVGRIIIAYAGTDPDTIGNFGKDVVIGTLMPTHPQYRQGSELFDSVKRKYPGLEITVTGHSLGGAIASYVSIERRVNAYVFNPSVALSPSSIIHSMFQKNRIFAVSQYAEVLAAMRKVLPDPRSTYTTLGCVDDGSVKRHSMRSLAECLTYVAAWDSTQAKAKESLEINGLLPLKRIDPETNTLTL